MYDEKLPYQIIKQTSDSKNTINNLRFNSDETFLFLIRTLNEK